MTAPLSAVALLFAAAVSTNSMAQAVYRCGNTFSGSPCGADAKVVIAPPTAPAKLQEPPAAPAPSDEVVQINKAVCEKRTRAMLKDPESARIKLVSRGGVALQRMDGKAFYGVSYNMNVNAKNGYGAYTGERLYNCVFALDEKTYLGSQEIAPWPN